ncbi:NAD(P)/FAD-dependent oxidoreductase [Spectribacter hydrogenoxidans]|uniref:NAD(P)/FAD-dependent oxidoreductase n=1 Tax=Spectribacter hydrogenoxidans TaxID=3075608 RepID=A0ABU3BZS3_9GAMM|nr:NAD(P)/FAD-dependent oxidoreductase [Salinisphaera sp. W335]MDT0634611.1 NAD(P)/FAD-dependent oxidoreductase [Salinisphaera sp. W335]
MSQQHYDVLIIGAGLAGIGNACHIARECPDKSLAILERRERMGGTWDLFKYPGIRSDSDMFSFGYKFRPWHDLKTLADGPAIRRYIADTAEAYGLQDKIRYGMKIIRSDWSSVERRWNLTALHEATGETRAFSCNFLVSCTGYYDHDAGFRPEFPGEENFKGTKIHPQHWPEDLDYAGRKVVVIGSGATAVTLVPAMAGTAGHVTMLQRSPSYVFSVPSFDRLTEALAKLLPGDLAYRFARKRNIWIQRGLYLACKRWPKTMRKFLLGQVRKRVGPDFDMTHFTPDYMPWDERLCAVPDGDLFRVLREGQASMATDHIERFTENGILLQSGEELEADIIVTATGLKLQMLGGMDLSIDGEPAPINRRMTYKGVLVENIPNMAWVFGYTNAPWTLKADLAARYLCRLIRHMDEHELDVVVPRDTGDNALDDGILDSLQSGYVQRDRHCLPRQGRTMPWQVLMHYGKDKKMLLDEAIEDERLAFLPARQAHAAVAQPDSVAA